MRDSQKKRICFTLEKCKSNNDVCQFAVRGWDTNEFKAKADDAYYICEITLTETEKGHKYFNVPHEVLEVMWDFLTDERYKVVKIEGNDVSDVLGRPPFQRG